MSMRALAAILLATAAIAQASPAGRVVRVERPRAAANVNPVLCEIKESLSGMCVGAAPRVGDIVIIVDETRTHGEVRLTKIEPQAKNCEALWMVTGELVRGDLSGSRRRSIGVIDPHADPRSVRQLSPDKIAAPNGDPDVQPVVGVDRDGDQSADVVLATSRCGNGTGGRMECFDIWAKKDKVMTRTFTADFRTCY